MRTRWWLDFPALMADYKSYHTHPMNRLCHAIGIPMLTYCFVHWTRVDGFPWIMALLGFYVFWDFGLAVILGLLALVMNLAAPWINNWVVAGLFIVGWIFQFVGHMVFEGNNPAFAKNLLHLLIGPMWFAQALRGFTLRN